MNRLWNEYKRHLRDVRPFLRTKVGSRLAILGILDFIVLFFAPLLHGFVGTALFGCVASVYLILIWRRYDSAHVIVPTVLLCIPMLLDMLIYRELSVVVGFLVAMIAMFIAALSPLIGFFDRITDLINSLLAAGALCVGVVVLACVMLVLVNIAWWILCIIAFFAVVAVFLAVVFSTAAYTASDGRRQARRNHTRTEQNEESDPRPESDRERRYREYRPRQRDTKIYNLDDDDFTDVE